MTEQNYLKALVDLRDLPDGLDVGDVVSYSEEFLSGTVLEPQDYIVARLLEGKDGAPVMAFLTRVDADMNPIPVPTVTRVNAVSGLAGMVKYTVQYSDGAAVEAGATKIRMPVYPFYKGTPWLRVEPVPVRDASFAFHRSDGYAWFPTRVDLPPGTMPMTRDEARELRKELRGLSDAPSADGGDPLSVSELTLRLVLYERGPTSFDWRAEREWVPGEVDLDERVDVRYARDDDRIVTVNKYEVWEVMLPSWLSVSEWLSNEIPYRYLWGGTKARPDWPEVWSRQLAEFQFAEQYNYSDLLANVNPGSNFFRSLRDQMIRWFDTPPEKRRFARPLSPRQYARIERSKREIDGAAERVRQRGYDGLERKRLDREDTRELERVARKDAERAAEREAEPEADTRVPAKEAYAFYKETARNLVHAGILENLNTFVEGMKLATADNPVEVGGVLAFYKVWLLNGADPIKLLVGFRAPHESQEPYEIAILTVKPDGTTDAKPDVRYTGATMDEVIDDLILALSGRTYEPLTPAQREAADKIGRKAPTVERVAAIVAVAAPERLIYFTDAEEGYDGFGTRTVEIVGEGRKGRPIRKVSIDPDHEKWQITRYSSGLNFSVPEDQWEADKDLYLKKMQTFDAYVADKVAADPDASVAYANILADLVRQEEGGTPVIKRAGRDAVVELPEFGKSGPRSVRIDPVGGVTTQGVKPKGRVLNHYFDALEKELEVRFADGLGKTFDFGTKDGFHHGPGTLLYFAGHHGGVRLWTRFESGHGRGDVWVSLSAHLPPGDDSATDYGLGFEKGRNGKSYADPDLAVDIFAAKFEELVTDPRWKDAVKTSGTSDKPVSEDAVSPFSWDAHVNWLWTDPELSLKAYVGTDTEDNSLSWSVLGDWGSGHLDPQAGQVGVKMTSVEAVEKAAADAATVLGDFLAQLKPHDPRRQRLEQVWNKTDSDLRSEPGVTPRMITILRDHLPQDHPEFSYEMKPVVMELDELPDWTIARLLGEPIKVEPVEKKERAKWIRNRILERIRSKNLVKREELVSEYDVKRLGAKQPKKEITAVLSALKREGLAAYNKRMGYRGWYDPRGEIMARANFDAALDMLASGEYDTAEDALGSYYDNMVDTFREEDTPKKVQEAAYSAWNRLVKDREIEERRRKAYGGTEPEPEPEEKWKRKTVTLTLTDGSKVDVSGHAKGAFLVHKILKKARGNQWQITHWPSGLRVPGGEIRTKEMAKAAADAVRAKFPELDTARNRDDLRAIPNLHELAGIVRDTEREWDRERRKRKRNPARARRDRRVDGQWQLTPASLTDDHYERAETQLATEQAKRILADGVLLGEGNFGKVYWLDDPDHADVVLKVPRDRALYGHQQEWTPEQKRDNLLHEAGVANEIRELGSTIVPDTVFVELGGDTPALVREYGDPIEQLSPTDYAEVEAALMALEPHGWRVQDELLVMRRPDGSLFVADVGVWSHDEKVTLSDLGDLLANWADSYGMDLHGATLPSIARDVESYEIFAEGDEDGDFATMERRHIANALAKRREAGVPTPAEYARFESAE